MRKKDQKNVIPCLYPAAGISRTGVERRKALLDAGALQTAIFNSANFSSIATDAGGVIQIFNVGAERMLGYAAAEVLNKVTPADLSDPRELVERAMALSLELRAAITPGFEALVYKSSRGIEDIYELTYIRKDGSRFPAVVSVTALRDGGGSIIGYLLIGTDNTGRKLAEDALRRVNEHMNQVHSLDALGVLVAGVAHNINNVLAIIMGTASLREEFATDPLDREDFSVINTACRRGRSVVKTLIKFAQPTISNQTPFELHGLIREVCTFLEITTRNRVRIVEALVAEPLWINGDAGSINHALVNLCLNSLDAMPEGGTLTFRTAVLEPGWLGVSVEDTGAGMDPEVLAHALEPFYTTKEVGKGTGLGLSMTYGVIKAHGGVLTLSSQPGQGTSVTFRLPRVSAPAQERTLAAPLPPLSRMKVLLVDDDPDVRILMTRMLRKAGVDQVMSVAGGELALASLASGEQPDLVILDQNMPGMNGIKALGLIRGLRPDLPVLISSGQPDLEEWECFKQPRVGVISKPFTMEEIRIKLAQFASGLASLPEPAGSSRVRPSA